METPTCSPSCRAGDFSEPQSELDKSEAAGSFGSALSDAVADLPERQQFILACRYREDLRMGEIGEVLGISESRVSQLHTKALISLRAAVGTPGGDRGLHPAHTAWN